MKPTHAQIAWLRAKADDAFADDSERAQAQALLDMLTSAATPAPRAAPNAEPKAAPKVKPAQPTAATGKGKIRVYELYSTGWKLQRFAKVRDAYDAMSGIGAREGLLGWAFAQNAPESGTDAPPAESIVTKPRWYYEAKTKGEEAEERLALLEHYRKIGAFREQDQIGGRFEPSEDVRDYESLTHTEKPCENAN
jgi:hypothetical protein